MTNHERRNDRSPADVAEQLLAEGLKRTFFNRDPRVVTVISQVYLQTILGAYESRRKRNARTASVRERVESALGEDYFKYVALSDKYQVPYRSEDVCDLLAFCEVLPSQDDTISIVNVPEEIVACALRQVLQRRKMVA